MDLAYGLQLQLLHQLHSTFISEKTMVPLSSEEENGVGALGSGPGSAQSVAAAAEQDQCFIKCPQCAQGYPGFQALKEHVEQAHPHALNGAGSPPPGAAASPPLTSTPTPSTASSNGILPVLPAPLRTKGGGYACAQCNVTFTSRDQLEKHELVHSPNIQVSCKVCNKTFANVYRLQRHMISHDESAVLRKFKCPECEKAFKFKHHLKEHIRIHSGEKPFECANCGKRFSHSGSYSSHMTSKKCLVMNLKVSRGANPKNGQPLPRNKRAPQLNNNNTSHNNNNNNTAFPTIMPKYGDAAAAFLSSFPTPPFYMPSLGAPLAHPYLGHILEQLSQQQAPPPAIAPPPDHSRTPSPRHDHDEDDRGHDLSAALEVSIEEEDKDGNCVKIEAEEAAREENGHPEPEEEQKHSNNGDLDRILATVSANVTKSFLEANMRKMSASPSSSGCPSPGEHGAPSSCRHCHATFSSGIDLHQHERYLCPAMPDLRDMHEQGPKSEGLAAKLEDVATGGAASGSDEEELTDHVSEDGRKVRVRSQITDEQLAILKPHYAANPRPKREELARIAGQVALPVRVVQVWFQNTRARDRREGRLVHAQHASFPLQPPPSPPPANAEQPLDLSTKKWQHSLNSSPSSSPARPSSSNSEDGAMNLSRKSRSPTRSPTPVAAQYRLPHYPLYARSPSPLGGLGSPLGWRYPAGAQKRHFQPDFAFFGLTQHLDGRANSSSPCSDRRSWKQCGPDGDDTPDETEDSTSALDEPSAKRRALGMPITPLLAGFGAPDGSPGPLDNEPEGQFVCKQCDKVFSKQSSLARHKFEHSGQRPHKCDVCPKAFKHKHHLTEHKRLHSGEKPFQCSKCLKRFSHSGSYSQHMNHRYSYCKPYRE